MKETSGGVKYEIEKPEIMIPTTSTGNRIKKRIRLRNNSFSFFTYLSPLPIFKKAQVLSAF
jgi:hypothetical protein